MATKSKKTTRSNKGGFLSEISDLDFRKRCIMSFKSAMDSINHLFKESDKGAKKSRDHIAMAIMEANIALCHSFEMLSKFSLNRISPFLLLEDLKYLDQSENSSVLVNSDKKWTGGKSSFMRAVKIFRIKLKRDEIGRIEKIIDSRNNFQHRNYSFSDMRSEKHPLSQAIQLLVKVYNKETKKGNLIVECKSYGSNDYSSIYNRLKNETSKEFSAIEDKVAKLASEGVIFIKCLSCSYEFAKLSTDHKSYECLWCGDKREERKCSISICNSKFWCNVESLDVKCHIHLPIQLGLLDISESIKIPNFNINDTLQDLPNLFSMPSHSLADTVKSINSALEASYSNSIKQYTSAIQNLNSTIQGVGQGGLFNNLSIDSSKDSIVKLKAESVSESKDKLDKVSMRKKRFNK